MKFRQILQATFNQLVHITKGPHYYRTLISRSTVAALLIIAIASALSAQNKVGSNRVTGVVVDRSGASIAGAAVSSDAVSAAADGEGRFSIALSNGAHELRISASGFSGDVRRIDLSGGNVDLGTIVLEVGPAEATVTVSDSPIYLVAAIQSTTKTFTSLRDVPQSVTVTKSEQMRDQMMSGIADVVRYVPGVSAHQGENNRDDVIFRGNRSSADFFRDGVRDDVQYYRDLYNLDRVETIRGSNAMVFGRGGGGGVINRVTKEAGFTPIRDFTASLGSYFQRRFTADIDQPLGKRLALRVNGLYEGADSFRKSVNSNRVGINPTLTFLPDNKTRITLGYEYLRDRRIADRGISSFAGRPADVPISTYYGDPDNSRVKADVNIFTASIDRVFGRLIVRNRTNYGDYERFYQNYVPGAVNALKTLVTLSAYNNSAHRRNLFNQTDLIYDVKTGKIRHTLAFGTEFGTQRTRNFRQTGYFNNLTTSTQVAYDRPQTNMPVTFRQSATDADNHLRLYLGAAYIQDQIAVSRYLQLIAGVRFDYFGLKYFNDRTASSLSRVDRLVSPRFGAVIKPFAELSLYGSYSVSFLPSSGDQFASLTNITQQVKPEQFTNYEAGAKWDLARGLYLTAAIYRLDRTNTRSVDPNDPTAIIQTGSQRSEGFEFGVTGSFSPKWVSSGGFTWQNARITSATASAAAGKQAAQVPHNTVSWWNKYSFTNRLSAGIGLIYRSDMFAAIDNTVVLPGYFRADAAVYYNINEKWRLQANIDNLTNVRYFANADGNNNISPGSPRSAKVGVVARF